MLPIQKLYKQACSYRKLYIIPAIKGPCSATRDLHQAAAKTPVTLYGGMTVGTTESATYNDKIWLAKDDFKSK